MLILNGSTPRIPILMVDSTDDETAETGLTPTVQISKNGGAFAAATNAAVEVGNGWYYVALTATETNTDGPLLVRATGTGSDEFRDYHQVYTNVAANVTQFGGTNGTFASGRPEVNTTHAAGTAWNSGAIGASTIGTGAIDADALAADAGTEISTAVWAAAARTLTALDEDSTTLDLDATIRGAVGLASANLDTQLSTIAGYIDTEVASVLAAVDTEVAAIKAKTDNLPSDPADASDIAASFTTVNGKLDTIDDFLDTEIAAIKAKTDQLTFGATNTVNANITHVIADPVQTNGATDTNWGGAP